MTTLSLPGHEHFTQGTMETHMKKVFLNEFNGLEAQELLNNAANTTAIVTFGSCESHGPHCCLGPDVFVPTEVARRVAMKLDNVVVAPCLPYGTSMHYNKFPLSITLRYETVIAVAEDVLCSLIHNGITRIFILNGHDGNIPALGIAAHKVKERHPEARPLFMPAWWEKIGPLMGDRFEVWNGLGHAGEGETSIMMAVRPELVDMTHAVSQVPENMIDINKAVNVIWDIAEVSKTGATGDPTKASMEKGEKMLELLTDLVADAITRMNRTNWEYTV